MVDHYMEHFLIMIIYLILFNSILNYKEKNEKKYSSSSFNGNGRKHINTCIKDRKTPLAYLYFYIIHHLDLDPKFQWVPM